MASTSPARSPWPAASSPWRPPACSPWSWPPSAQLSGLASEEAQTLRFTAQALDLRGLLIAGIVVGALGVLDDVTVSQVSTVAALRRAQPDMGARALYAEATRVGRDHVASTVNTLVLAYAGASLPLLLFFAQGDIPAVRIITGELVAVEVVRMLVGSIGLVLSVPVTTGLAALILTHTELPEDDGHGHHHGHVPQAAPQLDQGWHSPNPAATSATSHGRAPTPAATPRRALVLSAGRRQGVGTAAGQADPRHLAPRLPRRVARRAKKGTASMKLTGSPGSPRAHETRQRRTP